jgi:hypothetical protein
MALVTAILCSFQGCGWLNLPKLSLKGPMQKRKTVSPQMSLLVELREKKETQVSGFHLVPGRPSIHQHLFYLSPPLSSPSSYVGYLTSTASPVRAAVSQLLILQMSERDQVLIFVEEMKRPFNGLTGNATTNIRSTRHTREHGTNLL